MGLKVFSDVIDVAIVGLTNSGKSTFITSMIDRLKFGDSELLDKLHQNDGGLTKVTSFYELKACNKAKVVEVSFNYDSITNGISGNDVEAMNRRLNSAPYKKFNIKTITCLEGETFEASLQSSLNDFGNIIKNDIKYAISIINSPNADKILKHIKIQVPATNKVIEAMHRYGFTSVVLRDTRGFLDTDIGEIEKKTPTLADNGLDGIQACILMNGQDSTMPNLGREIYGDFVKSIFEAVPTFIIERSAKLAGKLEDVVDDGISISTDVYSGLVKNPKVTNLNFNEVHKFLNSLGIVKEDGNATNQLIEVHKRELLLPEVGVLKTKVIEYDSDEYRIYEFSVMEVFERLLKTLSDFRALLNKIVLFFDDPDKIKSIQAQYFNTFCKSIFIDIVREYYDYDRSSNVYVRPVTDGYDASNLLGNLVHKPLLGPRGGITTRYGQFEYGATGVFAVTARAVINDIIVNLKDYNDIVTVIKSYVDEPQNLNVFNAYVLEIQQCLKYVLQNSFTDIWASFSGYSIVNRYKVVTAINKVRDLWNNTYAPKHGDNAIDTVYLKSVKSLVKNNLPQYSVDFARVSQLYKAFYNITDEFFDCVSNNHDYLEDNNETSV